MTNLKEKNSKNSFIINNYNYNNYNNEFCNDANV